MLAGRKPREYHHPHRHPPPLILSPVPRIVLGDRRRRRRRRAYIIYDAVKRLAENPQVSADSGR